MARCIEYSLLRALAPMYGRWTMLGVVMVMMLVLVTCRSNSKSARDILDAEVEAFPVPPGSVILARNDRLGGGQIPECARVVTELLLGNSVPAEDIRQFYIKELPSQGWDIHFRGTNTIGLHKGERLGVEIFFDYHSDQYYLSLVATYDQIREWEQQFPSLTYIGIGYSFYNPDECEKALMPLNHWVKRQALLVPPYMGMKRI